MIKKIKQFSHLHGTVLLGFEAHEGVLTSR